MILSAFFHNLTPSELERLSLLAEECAETIQIIMKIQRHGYESYHPDDNLKTPNRALLEKELGHIAAAKKLLLEAHDIDNCHISRACKLKLSWIGRYLHHQDNIPEVDL